MDLIVHDDIVPAVDQIETHPFYQRTDDAAFLEEHDVQHESWGRSPKDGTISSNTTC